jgi:hypothetical protein
MGGLACVFDDCGPASAHGDVRRRRKASILITTDVPFDESPMMSHPGDKP